MAEHPRRRSGTHRCRARRGERRADKAGPRVAPGADLDQMTISLQRQGEKKQTGAASLGWKGPLETYRPILTYEELGAILSAEPKVLYDAISTVLGLEQLAKAVKALDEHKKSSIAPQTSLRNDKKVITQERDALEDERAVQASAILAARVLDTSGLRHLATGASTDTSAAGRLRALSPLALPSEEACQRAATELKAAVGDLAAVGERVGEALQRRWPFPPSGHDAGESLPLRRAGRSGAGNGPRQGRRPGEGAAGHRQDPAGDRLLPRRPFCQRSTSRSQARPNQGAGSLPRSELCPRAVEGLDPRTRRESVGGRTEDPRSPSSGDRRSDPDRRVAGKATYRKWALRKANSIHVKLQHGDPMDTCRDVEKTIADLRNGAR